MSKKNSLNDKELLPKIYAFLFLVMVGLVLNGLQGALAGAAVFVVAIMAIFLQGKLAPQQDAEADSPVFLPTPELEALLLRQSTEDKLRYLGVKSFEDLWNKYPGCVTQAEVDWYLRADNKVGNATGYEAVEASPICSSSYEPIKYDEDNTYDSFYMEREEEYRQEYGDDFEDAIDDSREAQRKNRR